MARCFEERLAAQRREREVATAELGFKKPLTKEEKIEKKKQRLAAIVLDGIGKGLDPRFDITEIAKPYALELLRFREAGVEDFRKRWDRQSQAFYNLFRQADRVEKLAQTIQRLEQGDLKLRVRALESERAFQRVAAVQNTIGSPPLVGEYCSLHLVVLVKLCLGKRRWCKVYINISMSSITSKSIASIYEAVQRRVFLFNSRHLVPYDALFDMIQTSNISDKSYLGNASMEIVRRVSGIYSLFLLSDILLMCMYAKQEFVVSNKGHLLVLSHINLFCVATAHPRRYFLIGIFATEAAGLRTGAILRTDLLML
ncbi:protein ACTIVITY OF BC1 COMPLEX kinase, chloroplastic [Sesamum angolense]|uniref:Protein ACTIVITY OF BC1 COMPLEX kinase, chloroplastic n=1 Tax=Sesamum angolense TaxID=2727404 RepID=A0AAE1W901_9LAMI|nr:protein ACTIVITY OF BC1 COMPLEX kinase, chloroplastic [Sesamum angolense]